MRPEIARLFDLTGQRALISAVFRASAASDFVNGHILHVDGSLTSVV